MTRKNSLESRSGFGSQKIGSCKVKFVETGMS